MPEPAKWESEHLAWQTEMRNKGSKELPEEFIQEKMVFEQEGGEGGLRRWQPAPRETEADLAMDTQSVRRKLDQRLFLLVKANGKLHTGSCSTIQFLIRLAYVYLMLTKL